MAGPRYRALLIGNWYFPEDRSNLPDLRGPINDVARLSDALVDPIVGMFNPGNVRVLTQRKAHDIIEALDLFFTGANRNDVLLFYYSGHGLTDHHGELLLCGQNSRTDRRLSTTVTSTQINSLIDASAAGTVVIILDCCYSGAFKSGNIGAPLAGAGRYILASCRSREHARDADMVSKLSHFTAHLVAGLHAAIATTGAEYITLSDLYRYVHEQAATARSAIPQRRFDGHGEIAIARRSTNRPILTVADHAAWHKSVAPVRTRAFRLIRLNPAVVVWLATASVILIVVVFGSVYLWRAQQPPARRSVINEYLLNTSTSGPSGITLGPDHNIWVTEQSGNQVARVTSTGIVTEFSVPTSAARPVGITYGPDGNLWFTEFAGNNIARITTTGSITEFPIPTIGSLPLNIVAGRDGNLWFTEAGGNKVGRITLQGIITEFSLPVTDNGANVQGITTDPSGTLWFTERFGNRIGRMSPSGAIATFPVPSKQSEPISIAMGPDGNLWFTESAANKIGRMTTTGEFTEFTLCEVNSIPFGIVVGSDGNLWFTAQRGNYIGRITVSGTITVFDVPTANAGPGVAAMDSEGIMWFIEGNANGVGRLATRGVGGGRPCK